jgi:hypothetical protein
MTDESIIDDLNWMLRERDSEIKDIRAELEKFQSMWIEQREWLKRVRDSGQRERSVAALMNMDDIEKRELGEKK